MDVQLTPDQKAFAQQAIQAGRIRHEEEAVREALALWENRERTRSEILATLDTAEASLDRGEGRVITEQSMIDLAHDVKQRARARFATEQSPPQLMAHRVSPEAEAELDGIWYYIATESGSMDVADRFHRLIK